MGKYWLAGFWGVLLIIASIYFVKYIKPANMNLENESGIVNTKNIHANFDNLTEPDLVIITAEDSLYHDSSCYNIEGRNRSLSKDKAVKQGFYPCSVCLEYED